MTANGWLQIIVFLGLVLAITKPLGVFMANVFNRERTFLDPVARPLERALRPIVVGRRAQRLQHPGAPALGGEPAVPGLAGTPLPRPLRARDGAHPRHAWWQGLRLALRRAHDGAGPLGRLDPPALHPSRRYP